MTQILIAVAIIGSIGLLGGTLLSVISTLCNKGEDNARLEEIRDSLPGANCGACGFAGCDSYAEAVEKGEAEPNLCSPGGADAAAKLAEILGVEVVSTPKKAKVLCNGCTDNVDTKYNYGGMPSCAAAITLGGGPSACDYGCIGFGDCVRACRFDAIHVKDGVAVVDEAKCTGCNACAKVCPKKIITVTAKKKSATVKCSNHNKGAVAKKLCKTACIGCAACVRACEQGAITMDNFLAVIDTEKCNGCGKCAEKCVQKIIEIA